MTDADRSQGRCSRVVRHYVCGVVLSGPGRLRRCRLSASACTSTGGSRRTTCRALGRMLGCFTGRGCSTTMSSTQMLGASRLAGGRCRVRCIRRDGCR